MVFERAHKSPSVSRCPFNESGQEDSPEYVSSSGPSGLVENVRAYHSLGDFFSRPTVPKSDELAHLFEEGSTLLNSCVVSSHGLVALLWRVVHLQGEAPLKRWLLSCFVAARVPRPASLLRRSYSTTYGQRGVGNERRLRRAQPVWHRTAEHQGLLHGHERLFMGGHTIKAGCHRSFSYRLPKRDTTPSMTRGRRADCLAKLLVGRTARYRTSISDVALPQAR